MQAMEGSVVVVLTVPSFLHGGHAKGPALGSKVELFGAGQVVVVPCFFQHHCLAIPGRFEASR
jgi:hypothetical protein